MIVAKQINKSEILIEKSKKNEALIPCILESEPSQYKFIIELRQINSSIFKNAVYVGFFQKMKAYHEESFERNSKFEHMQDIAKNDKHKVEIYNKCAERVFERYQNAVDKFNYKLINIHLTN